MKVDGQEEKVVRFFDRIAQDYNRKYDTEDPLRHYFFTQRLEKSTEGLEFDGKTVLDIGSGTGTLYDYLAARHRMAAFYACDISEEMLSQSRLPPAQRFVGKAYQTRFPIESFDYIYMLGVTTYMPRDELTRNIRFLETHLEKDGMAIISFTNRDSLDQTARRIVRPFLKIIGRGKNVVMQPFELYAYTIEEVTEILAGNWRIEKIAHLNHTICPLNMIFKKPSVALAECFERKLKNERLRSLCSSDFLLFLRRRTAESAT